MTAAPTGDRRLRVLLVTGAYAPEISSGGLQAQMVARRLADRVAFQVLTTAVDRTLPRHATVDDVPVSRVVVDVDSARSKLPSVLPMLGELTSLMRNVDVVHVHGYSQKNLPVTAFAQLIRVPMILSLHTAGFDEPAAIRRHGRLASWSLAAPRMFLTVSPHLTEACATAGVRRDRIRQVANGVDLERFRPADAAERRVLRQSLGLAPDGRVVLFVGFFSREKQPQILFDAWLRLQRQGMTSTLVFVGATQSHYFEVDSVLADDMRERARVAGVLDRLVFVDPTPRIDQYYRSADVFALPSSREGLPVALLEAMACGVPSVASRLPGATDIVIDDGRTGVLVAPGDVDALGAALHDLLINRERAAAIGEAARRHIAANFSAAQTAAGWLDAYRTVTAAA
jgi:glycosyltransferase involved in cell wall biosynthesis